MSDNLAQLDGGGSNAQWTKVYLGPSLGWAMLPIVPEITVTQTTPFGVPNYASRILLKAAVKLISLPQCSAWMLAQPATGNQAAFDRSIWIKDLIGDASSAAPIMITPFPGDTIDGLFSYGIITPKQLIRLYPLTDLSGWYVG